jgi:hypothetical protein
MELHRAADGSLAPAGAVPTGGLGTGAGLGSQGALALSGNGRWLFAVNAGSHSISSLRVEESGPVLVDRTASGGLVPISLTVSGDLLYVLNAGGVFPNAVAPSCIVGFRVGRDGRLTALPGSKRLLSTAMPGPAEVSFNDQGDLLMVTEKNTNLIDTFTVGKNGLATGPIVHPSSGTVPFGFQFGKRDVAIVSEASGAVSSYQAAKDGGLSVITPSAVTHQTAACWIAITGNGKYAYTTNAGSNSISGYSVATDGSLALLDPSGITASTGAGSHPTDMAFSVNSQYLYALGAGANHIAAYRVMEDGSLQPLDGFAGIPGSTVGLVAR